jgi:hypothetical protein
MQERISIEHMANGNQRGKLTVTVRSEEEK